MEKNRQTESVCRFGYHGGNAASPDIYSQLLAFSRENRKHPTQAETAIWQGIRDSQLGVRFRRQHIIGDCIVDFVALEQHLVVEIDGKYHLQEERQQLDANRTLYLEHLGFRIIRFTNEEVLANRNAVLQKIKAALSEISTN